MKPAIAYVRVSDQKQGRSGLGIEAQIAAITTFAASYSYDIIDVVTEVETGTGVDALTTRPQLATALEIARLTGAVVVAAKLDRITRNVHFGSGLFGRTDIAFKIADMPHADNFQLNIMLAVAQLEAEMISNRTKAALQAAKARGVVLGQPVGNAKQKERSVARAASLRDVLEPIKHLSSRAIAAVLNARGIATERGGQWQSATVLRLISKLEVAT